MQVWDKADRVTAARTYYVLPEYKPPVDTTPAAVADQDVRQRTWKWDGTETMYPFWAVPRLSKAEVTQRNAASKDAPVQINMAFEEKELAVVVPGVNGIVLAVRVPILVNTVALPRRAELVCEAQPKAAPKKRAATDWKADAKKDEKDTTAKRPKAKPKADASGRIIL